MKVNRNTLLKVGAASVAAYGLWKLLRKDGISNFNNKVVLVSGASRGLGLVLARQLAAHGAKLMLTARNSDELQTALKNIKAISADVNVYAADFRDPAQVRAVVAKTKETYGRIDVAIHNAGVISVGPFEAMTDEDFNDEMKIHFNAAFHLAREVVPLMKKQGGGNIVNISSIGGLIPVPHMLPYCASKFALVGFSEGLNAELAGDKIVVTTVCPGLMRTGSIYHAAYKGKARKEKAWFSLLGGLPILSVEPERAAREILAATLQGKSLHVISWPAKLAVKMHQLLPNFWAGANRFLIRGLPQGDNRLAYKGFEIKERVPEFIKEIHKSAAQANNELPSEL